MSEGSPRILVVGCGSIGGTVAAHLSEVGANVTSLTTNERIARAVRESGYRVQGDGNPRAVPGKILQEVPQGEIYDYIFLATQPPQVEEAASSVKDLLAENGNMVVFQNGLCESRIASIVGEERVIGAIVAWGASMFEPGVYERTSSGGFTLGRIDGTLDPAISELKSMLEVVGPVTLTNNLVGARWSKLAINCAISSLGTLGGERLGPLVRVRKYRRLTLEIFTEVVAVAKYEKINLEKVAGTIDLDWIALPEELRKQKASPGLAARHALLLAVGLRFRRMRSSMLSAIERGRKPAIDFLNGEIAKRGEEYGIPTPVNSLVTKTVHKLASGEKKPSRKTLDEIFDATPRSS